MGPKLPTTSRRPAGSHSALKSDLENQQAKLDVVRDAFGKKFPMISALKQGIAIYAKDPAWAKVRPPLVELTAAQARALAAELKAISFGMPGLFKAEKLRAESCRNGCAATAGLSKLP